MDRTLLNADVLLFVFTLGNKQTKLALMSTCKTLYREGRKQFLKFEDVKLRTETHLRSFLLYIAADGGCRMRSLRRLTIVLQNPSRSIAEQLTVMVTRLAPVSQLSDLSIDSMETLLSAHPPLCQAIAALTSIKEIYFSNVGTLTRETLNSMRSDIETVDIGFHPSQDGAAGDPIILLRRFSSSLRRLSVSSHGTAIGPQDDSPQYPLLSELELEEPALPFTWDYVRTFPNLKRLSIPTTECVAQIAEEEWDDAVRARNVAQLHEPGHRCWASLDVFEGSIYMLWLLALSCPIPELHLRYFGHSPANILSDVVGTARPVRLYLDFFMIWLFLDEAFTRAFAEACGDTLRVFHLSLDIDFGEHDFFEDDLDLGDVLDAIADMLRSFTALESFALEIQFPTSYRAKLTSKEVFADDIDMDAMCAGLHNAISSTTHVCFSINDRWKQGTAAVKIGSEGGNSK